MKLEIAKLIAEKMFVKVADNWNAYDPEDDDFEGVFEQIFSDMWIPEVEYMDYWNSKPVVDECEEIKIYVIEAWKDQLEYDKNPLAYYGMKQSDFL